VPPAALAAAIGVLLSACGAGGEQPAPQAAPARTPVPSAPPGEAGREPTAFLHPSGDDAADCSREAPCATFDRAYRAAAPGTAVEVAAGRYPEQVMTRDPARVSRDDVTFRPAPGASVRVAGLAFGQWTDDRGAEHVEVRDMRIGTIVARRTADLTFRDLRLRSFWIEGGRRIRFLGGSVGGIRGSNPWIGTWRGSDGSTNVPRDVLIDGVEFHDVRMRHRTDHIECLHINDVDGFVLRNSRFHDCDTFDVLVMYGFEEVLRDIVVEGNDFGETGNSFGGPAYFGLSLRFGRNVTVRDNTSDAPWAGPDAGGGPVTGSWIVEGNTFPGLQSCPQNVTFRDNVWTGPGARTCGPGDRLP
jgi:hypothetical protein